MTIWKKNKITAISICILLVAAIVLYPLERRLREDVLNAWSYALIPICCVYGFFGKSEIVVAVVAIMTSFVVSFMYSSDMGGELANGLAAGILTLAALASIPCTIIAILLGITWRRLHSKIVGGEN